MIHFLPATCAQPLPMEDAELAGRMAGLRRALRLIDRHGGGPSDDLDDHLGGASFAIPSDAVRVCFDRRSERAIGAAAAGLDALVGERGGGREPHPCSLDVLSDDISNSLADLARLLRD